MMDIDEASMTAIASKIDQPKRLRLIPFRALLSLNNHNYWTGRRYRKRRGNGTKSDGRQDGEIVALDEEGFHDLKESDDQVVNYVPKPGPGILEKVKVSDCQ